MRRCWKNTALRNSHLLRHAGTAAQAVSCSEQDQADFHLNARTPPRQTQRCHFPGGFTGTHPRQVLENTSAGCHSNRVKRKTSDIQARILPTNAQQLSASFKTKPTGLLAGLIDSSRCFLWSQNDVNIFHYKELLLYCLKRCAVSQSSFQCDSLGRIKFNRKRTRLLPA